MTDTDPNRPAKNMDREELEAYCADLEDTLYYAERGLIDEYATSSRPRKCAAKAYLNGEILAFVNNDYDG